MILNHFVYPELFEKVGQWCVHLVVFPVTVVKEVEGRKQYYFERIARKRTLGNTEWKASKEAIAISRSNTATDLPIGKGFCFYQYWHQIFNKRKKWNILSFVEILYTLELFSLRFWDILRTFGDPTRFNKVLQKSVWSCKILQD